MKLKNNAGTVIAAEIVMFLFILIILWLDDFVDMPHLLFGATPMPDRVEEFVIETVSVTLVAVIVIIVTALLLRRMNRMERFLRVCAWCKRIWIGDQWVGFEEYIKKEHRLQSSHGICPECLHKMRGEAASMITNHRPKAD